MLPLVSIAMPVYNAEKTVLFAISSLIAQSYRNWECLVCNDGSTDNSKSIIKNLKDKRIKYIEFDGNKGRSAARQAILDNANGKYLGMLDADDWYYPNKLELQVKCLESNNELALVSSFMSCLDTHRHLLGIRGVRNISKEILIYNQYNTISDSPPVPHAPSLIHMDIAKKHHYDIRLLRSQDTDFMIRVLQGYKFGIICEPLYTYEEQTIDRTDKILEGYKYTRMFLKKYIHKFFVKSMYLIIRLYFKSVILKLFGMNNLDKSHYKNTLIKADQNRKIKFIYAQNKVMSIYNKLKV